MSWKYRHNTPSRIAGRAGVARRQRVLERWPTCYLCGVKESTVADHVVPLSQGGADDESNMAGACTDCHDRKTARESAHGKRATRRYQPPLSKILGARSDTANPRSAVSLPEISGAGSTIPKQPRRYPSGPRPGWRVGPDVPAKGSPEWTTWYHSEWAAYYGAAWPNQGGDQ